MKGQEQKDTVIFKASGRCSKFGGPGDAGVSASEGLALFWSDEIILDYFDPLGKRLFLLEQPLNTSGLARRLNPNAFYIACRWPRDVQKSIRRTSYCKITSKGKQVHASPVDFGPATWTKRVADCSPGVMLALGLHTNDQVEVELVL